MLGSKEQVVEPIAIKIEYWTLPDGSPTGEEPAGIEEFRSELQEVYVSLVRGQSGVCGGGLYDFIVHFTTSITLREVVSAILGGVGYDLVKSGTHSFILRPLISAFSKLKTRNEKRAIDVGELRFSFQDCDVVIKNIGIGPLFDDLEGIMNALAVIFEVLKGESGEPPYVIHIPIFEDPDSNICRFRTLLDVDETLEGVNRESYLHFWGIRYNLESRMRVLDVNRRLLIDSSYMTQEEYWEACDLKRVKENATQQGASTNSKMSHD